MPEKYVALAVLMAFGVALFCLFLYGIASAFPPDKPKPKPPEAKKEEEPTLAQMVDILANWEPVITKSNRNELLDELWIMQDGTESEPEPAPQPTGNILTQTVDALARVLSEEQALKEGCVAFYVGLLRQDIPEEYKQDAKLRWAWQDGWDLASVGGLSRPKTIDVDAEVKAGNLPELTNV